LELDKVHGADSIAEIRGHFNCRS